MNESRPIGQARLPSVDQVLRTDVGAAASARFGHKATVNAIRRTVSALREVVRGEAAVRADVAAIAAEATQLLEREDAPSLRRVFNLTGTVLHTNLGRAVLPESAIAAAADAFRRAEAMDPGFATTPSREAPASAEALQLEKARSFQLRWVAGENDTTSPADSLPDVNDLSGQKRLRVQKEVLLDGAAVESAGFAKFEPDRSEITVLLTDAGGRRFADVTRTNIGQRLAIVWNGRVLSAPVIRDAITGRQVMVTGNFGYAESQLLVDVLNHRNR
jgi:preprotein translocase subunit SecD